MTAAFAGVGRLLMAGCGNMGGAMLARWLEAGLEPQRIAVLSPSMRPIRGGVSVIAQAPTNSLVDTLVVAMKPQQLRLAYAAGLGSLRPTLVISILAGVETASLVALWPDAAVVRAMPNLPVALGEGVVVLHGKVPDPTKTAVTNMMGSLGLAEWVDDESSFDLLTALAGSGPAFLYRFIDALGAAGAQLGLSGDQSARLALATVKGAASLAVAASDKPAMLADRVASPGGSTRAGLDVLDRDGALVDLLVRTLAAATRRNRELAEAAKFS